MVRNELIDIFAKDLIDELNARNDYVKLADRLDQFGLPNAANAVRGIARDENNHAQIIQSITHKVFWYTWSARDVQVGTILVSTQTSKNVNDALVNVKKRILAEHNDHPFNITVFSDSLADTKAIGTWRYSNGKIQRL